MSGILVLCLCACVALVSAHDERRPYSKYPNTRLNNNYAPLRYFNNYDTQRFYNNYNPFHFGCPLWARGISRVGQGIVPGMGRGIGLRMGFGVGFRIGQEIARQERLRRYQRYMFAQPGYRSNLLASRRFQRFDGRQFNRIGALKNKFGYPIGFGNNAFNRQVENRPPMYWNNRYGNRFMNPRYVNNRFNQPLPIRRLW